MKTIYIVEHRIIKTRTYEVESEDSEEAENMALEDPEKYAKDVSVDEEFDVYPKGHRPRDLKRKLCIDCILEHIKELKAGEIIKVVPEHECEFYTEEKKRGRKGH